MKITEGRSRSTMNKSTAPKTNAAAVAVGVSVGVGDDEVTVNVTLFDFVTCPFASVTCRKYV
jgi:hypothetical protein